MRFQVIYLKYLEFEITLTQSLQTLNKQTE